MEHRFVDPLTFGKELGRTGWVRACRIQIWVWGLFASMVYQGCLNLPGLLCLPFKKVEAISFAWRDDRSVSPYRNGAFGTGCGDVPLGFLNGRFQDTNIGAMCEFARNQQGGPVKLYMFATDGGSSRLWWEGSRAVGRLWRAEQVTKLSASVKGSDQGSSVSS